MIEKRITAKVDKVIKTGSLEEEQIQEINQLNQIFPENPEKEESKNLDTEKEQSNNG